MVEDVINLAGPWTSFRPLSH